MITIEDDLMISQREGATKRKLLFNLGESDTSLKNRNQGDISEIQFEKSLDKQEVNLN